VRAAVLLEREVSQLPKRYRAMLLGLTPSESMNALHAAIVNYEVGCVF